MSGTVSGLSPVATYLQAMTDESESAATYAKTDGVEQNYISTFEKDAVNITSASSLMSNYKALAVVLGAYGLSSIQNETALVKDLLTQDPSSTSSVAAKSANPAWQKFAAAFSVWNQASSSSSASSSSPFSDASSISSIVTSYEESKYESHLNDASNGSGIGNALYFTRAMTTDMTLSQIMSDSTLLKVVETVSGYDPTEFGALDYDQQVQMLKKSVNLSDFSSTEKIQKYAERYLAMLQITPQTSSQPATLLSLYGSDGSNTNVALSVFGISSASTSSLITALFG
ncbi:hypothetical protein AA23498_3116 [Acetobacter nitrogenifigens DSM 23921 = NBRC 105050]|uniref:Flagellar basal body rod protein FlgF n=1 Tax=Acetobacter nitrogenifigens DSM 23921 = NBRC 105050 TaxID=1120919 RepID=A0A511X5B9_9PROT|nr:DUF1217 domain-containing protein [Acetobacter nitrogenifigens]GBQ98145.1 hypothetical protein AA23498_3116 [Acetobacter nitrogenifigens DSM 23921 = NBRC 105050]GEN58167.1 flagellar basal body rod protein FlgF [Acetobacter nitrogenifigens DSM 23921 = NBRC 105050]